MRIFYVFFLFLKTCYKNRRVWKNTEFEIFQNPLIKFEKITPLPHTKEKYSSEILAVYAIPKIWRSNIIWVFILWITKFDNRVKIIK